MSAYPKGKEPVCPLQHPGCAGVIKERGARSCASCAKVQRTLGAAVKVSLSPEASVEADRAKLKNTSELVTLRKKYDIALRTIERQDRQLNVAGALDSSINTFRIEAQQSSGTSEATPVVVASDWHIEERVGAEVGGLNFFNLAIAHERAERFWRSTLRLIQLLNKDVTINTVVLALLGDFITGNIHGEENAELNELQPVHAIVEAQDMVASGLEYLLENSHYNFIITAHSGNHARTTHTTRFSAENGHSLEYLMYRHLAAYFRLKYPGRVTFVVPEAPMSYLTIYDKTYRFLHGHMIKFGGGVGGIYIPTAKKLAKWDQARHADLTVFGHFHQQVDGGNFLVNGSLIGYNGYALSIGAAHEPPKQLLFLLDKKRGRTATWPIYLDK